MAKVDEIAFRSIERRLAKALLHHAEASNTVAITHDALATEVATAREVVSRKLSQWAQAGLINKGRGEIELLNLDQLRLIANDLNQ